MEEIRECGFNEQHERCFDVVALWGQPILEIKTKSGKRYISPEMAHAEIDRAVERVFEKLNRTSYRQKVL